MLSIVCDPTKLKWDEEKSKHVNLAQQNGFGPALIFAQFAEVGNLEACEQSLTGAGD